MIQAPGPLSGRNLPFIVATGFPPGNTVYGEDRPIVAVPIIEKGGPDAASYGVVFVRPLSSWKKKGTKAFYSETFHLMPSLLFFLPRRARLPRLLHLRGWPIDVDQSLKQESGFS